MTRIFEDDLQSALATRVVHAGQRPEQTSGAIMTPIYQTSTYVQPKLGEHHGFEYARTRNPTRDALERNLAALEGARHGYAFSSGMAATDAVLKLLRAGDHVVCSANVYGGTYRIMTHVYEQLGLTFTFVDTRDVGAIQSAISSATKMIYIETPTNPMMHITNLGAVAALGREHEVIVVADNTFATPIFQRPIEFGVTIVLHSTTKYLNGHSDMVGGIVVTNRDDLAERLGFIQNASGAVPGPLDCWLALRGIKTLAVRMRQHDQSGRAIAAWLSEHPTIERVYYPGLPSHPQHELACQQMSGFGGMISLEFGTLARARTMVESTRLFAFAESLGGVESLIGHPASMTHASVPHAMREAMGLSDGLVRLSVGIEDMQDLIKDLDQALNKVSASAVPTHRA